MRLKAVTMCLAPRQITVILCVQRVAMSQPGRIAANIYLSGAQKNRQWVTYSGEGLRQSRPIAKKNLLELTQRENSDETDEGADHATRRLDNVDWCSSCEGCRIMPTVEECLSCMYLAPTRRPPIVDQWRETTRSNAIAHMIYTSRTKL